MTNPVPLTIIGGFLGAGKTTLLNYILTENHGVRAAVLVNDFGAINIDAKLVVGVEGETVDLANGCICCTIRTDLISACLKVLNRPDPPEIIIIETSGVSDAKEVILTFDDPSLQSLTTIDCVISVVDAELFPDLLDSEMRDLAVSQVHAADVVVLNKIDLVGEDQRVAVRALVKEISPRSRLIETTNGRIPLAVVLGANAQIQADRHVLEPHENGADGTHHHHHHAGHPFSTWHWRSNKPLSLSKLRAVIEDLPEAVYRAKGILQLEELPTYKIAFQMVGKRYNFRDTDPWGEETPVSEIVLIASHEGFDPDSLQAQFEGCIGTGDESQSAILKLARKLEMAAT